MIKLVNILQEIQFAKPKAKIKDDNGDGDEVMVLKRDVKWEDIKDQLDQMEKLQYYGRDPKGTLWAYVIFVEDGSKGWWIQDELDFNYK